MSFSLNKVRLVFSHLSVFLLLFQTTAAQYNFDAMDDYLKRNQKAFGNHFSMVVYKDGKVVYQKDMGEFNAKTQAPVAAASNWITAALVMTFVDQQKIALDDPVGKYLPVFDKYMKSYITIRHCLSHTTGIENTAKIGKLSPKRKYESLEEEVNAFAAREISANAGEEFHYGNVGLNIAGRVLEVISKKSFERLAQERIFRPLKMRGTNFNNDEGGTINPALGARSTANDFINFLSMLLNKGTFEGKRILSEESVLEMQKAQFTSLPVKFIPKQAEGMQYGLGEWVSADDGKTTATSPGLEGTWPYIDVCRNYACVLLVKSPLKSDGPQTFRQIKDIFDEQFPCK